MGIKLTDLEEVETRKNTVRKVVKRVILMEMTELQGVKKGNSSKTQDEDSLISGRASVES